MYHCRYIHPFIYSQDRSRSNRYPQSFNVLYGVRTDKNESRILRGYMPSHIQSRASEKAPRPVKLPYTRDSSKRVKQIEIK